MKKKLDKTSSNLFLNEFFWKSPTRMVIADPEDGTIVDANKSYLDFYGYSREQVIGKTAAELGHMDKKEMKKVWNQRKVTGCAENILVKVKDKNNELRYVLLNIVPIIVNKKLFFLTFGTDISSSVLAAKKQRDDILKIYDSCDNEGVILISDYETENESLSYMNDTAKKLFKKYPLNNLLKKLKGHESVLLTVGSKSYHVRKVGNHNSSNLQLIVIYSLPDSMHNKQTMEKYDFTPRQREVALLALNGHSNGEIAEKLCISEYTVKDHMKDIFHIMRIRNRSELFPKLFNLR
jgi:PAS domain S-box-containing protein